MTTNGVDVTPPLEVVVVTYCAPEYVAGCLRSALDYTPAQTIVHVVDNASPDRTADRIERDFPEIELVRNSSNDGFAVANNLVLSGVRAPFALLLNPDARLEPETLAPLMDHLRDNPDVAVVGCRLLKEDGQLDHAAKRSVPRPQDALIYFAGRLIGRRPGRYTAPEIAEFDVADVDAVNGAFMLVRTAAMAQVGLLDGRYWMYGEDLDWCVRFRDSGWRVVYYGRATAHHAKGGSSGIRSTKLTYHFHRSMALFYREHVAHSAWGACIGSAAIIALGVIAVCANSARRLYRNTINGNNS